MVQPLVYLSRGDVEASLPEPGEMVAAVESIFESRAAGRAQGKPKTGLYTEDGNFFFGLMAFSEDLGYTLCHNSMGTPLDKVHSSLHHIHSMEILTDIETAAPIAVMDAFWMATWVPACITAVAAKRLAKANPKIVGFVASGAQARANLATLRAVFEIEEVRAHDARPDSAEAFAAHAKEQGLTAAWSEDPQAAVTGCDIVVTSVPNHPALEPFLEPDWVGPGGFVSMVDLARSWRPGLERFDRLATDDHDQAKSQFADGRLKFGGPYDSDITELVSGARPRREDSNHRAAVIHPGHAIGILALAALIHDRARAAGRGTSLPQ